MAVETRVQIFGPYRECGPHHHEIALLWSLNILEVSANIIDNRESAVLDSIKIGEGEVVKNAVRSGVVLTLSLAVALPAFSQRGGRGGGGNAAETTAFQDFTEEVSPARKVLLGEDFIAANKKSTFRPQIDQQLADIYAKQKEWKKVEDVADRVQKELPDSSPKSKLPVYIQGMLAARNLNDVENAEKFGDLVIAADPTDINPAQILPAVILGHLPADATARLAALNKALDYARKGAELQKPPRVSDADWNGAQSRIHSSMGYIYGSLDKLPEAVMEYGIALKANNKDAESHFRLGMIYVFQMQDAGAMFTTANKAALDAAAAKVDQAKLNELANNRDAIAEEVIAKRDMAIDSFARAIAIGGSIAQPARQQLEPLYLNKNGADSAKGIDQFVSSKKTELGL